VAKGNGKGKRGLV